MFGSMFKTALRGKICLYGPIFLHIQSTSCNLEDKPTDQYNPLGHAEGNLFLKLFPFAFFLFKKWNVYLIYNSPFKFIVSTGHKNPELYAWIFAKREFYLFRNSFHFFFWTLAPTSTLVFNKQSSIQVYFFLSDPYPLTKLHWNHCFLKFYRIYILYYLFDLNQILFNSCNREH